MGTEDEPTLKAHKFSAIRIFQTGFSAILSFQRLFLVLVCGQQFKRERMILWQYFGSEGGKPLLLVTHSPSEVLRGVLGRTYPEEVLSRALYATQFTRHLDRHGYLKFKHWRFLGKMGWPEKRFPCGSMSALPPKPGFHGKNVVTPMCEDEQNAPVF